MGGVKLRATSLLLIAFAASAGVFTFAPQAHADYAVLKSGVRLHITGYEQTGETIRLTITGGTVEVPAAELASIEPEDQFTAPPVALVAAPGPYGSLIRAAAEKHGVDEKLITHVIAVESNFNPRAASHKQALGLMQPLPTTAYKAGPETGTRYGGLPPFPETQKYVQKITTILAREKLQIPNN